MPFAETRHFEGIGNDAASLLGERLDRRVGVVMGDDDRVLGHQQLLDAGDIGGARGRRLVLRRLHPVEMLDHDFRNRAPSAMADVKNQP